MWPPTVGKATAEYLEEATSRLHREKFAVALQSFLSRHSLKLTVSDSEMQVLFEISEEYHRKLDAISSMRRDGLVRDWKRRKKLMESIDAHLGALQKSLEKRRFDSGCPNTVLLAESTAQRLARLRKKLRTEFGLVKHYQLAGEIMLRSLSPKYQRNGYVAELNHYIEQCAFPSLKQTERDVLLAGTMFAAQMFTARETREDIVGRMPMARSRAKRFIRQAFLDANGENDGPVFQTEPKKQHI